MIAPKFFFELLRKNQINFFCGVPDSLLKDFCSYVSDGTTSEEHIIAANEGGALALVAGHYLATGRIGLVYMQNSGIGNAVNPLLSLLDTSVYSIPSLLLIGWRGEPNLSDEPQHIKQGLVTTGLLDAMEIPHLVLSDNEDEIAAQIAIAMKYLNKANAPFAIIVRKGTFGSYTQTSRDSSPNEMTREQAIIKIVNAMGTTDIVISTTGMASRELYEYRNQLKQDHSRDFLTVGSMGHVSQIALSIALQKKKQKVLCLDGDGSVIMHMGSMAIVGTSKAKNFRHIVINNASHDSVGGQPTVADKISIPAIALAMGYTSVESISESRELEAYLPGFLDRTGPSLLEIKVRKGSRLNLGRPASTPKQNKSDFMNFLNKTK
jgi:phosphonopyruvate decarboxylase